MDDRTNFVLIQNELFKFLIQIFCSKMRKIRKKSRIVNMNSIELVVINLTVKTYVNKLDFQFSLKLLSEFSKLKMHILENF